MGKRDLDSLHAGYVADPIAGLEPLLIAVRRKALAILRNDDAAQDFVIGVWQALPKLSINRSFVSWLQVRLRWHQSNVRRSAKSSREEQPPELFGDDGESLSHEEVLDLLAYKHAQSQPKPEPSPDLDSIDDPMIRRVAELLLLGYSQTECADKLNLKPPALRQRLRRYRATHQETEDMPLAA